MRSFAWSEGIGRIIDTQCRVAGSRGRGRCLGGLVLLGPKHSVRLENAARDDFRRPIAVGASFSHQESSTQPTPLKNARSYYLRYQKESLGFETSIIITHPYRNAEPYSNLKHLLRSIQTPTSKYHSLLILAASTMGSSCTSGPALLAFAQKPPSNTLDTSLRDFA
jgi:hypothetical protein